MPKVNTSLVPRGPEDVDGVHWVAYEGDEGAEPLWVTRLGNAVTVGVTGAGDTDAFRTVARAVQAATPLPVRPCRVEIDEMQGSSWCLAAKR